MKHGEHVAIEHQPVPFEGNLWPIHSNDASGQWYRPAGFYGAGIYPLFDPPEPGLEAEFCQEHKVWEWSPKA